MELRQLQYAVQIAEERSFSRAAEKLHIAQPSLSQQLSKLEKEIGLLLFQRTTNSVELTHAGSLFVDKAQRILDLAEQLKQEMEDISQMKKGKLIVGSMPITGSTILPLVLPVFRAAFPNIDIALVEETSGTLAALTASGGTDISLLSLPLQEDTLDVDPFLEEEIVLAVYPDHELVRKHANESSPLISIGELKDEPFIALKKGQGLRQITLELCQKAGFTPRIAFESSNMETVQSLVAAGMGIALVPILISRKTAGGLTPVYLRIASRPARTLVIAHRKGRYLSKAAESFIRIIKEVMHAQ
jgi:LysR family transcriptional regulator, hydrogen peroxide-inducible genes activator